MTIFSLSEWYRIGIQKETIGYPLGGEGPVPYYYKTPDLYASVNGIFGAAFLFLTLLSIWSFFRYKKRAGAIAFALIIVVIGAMYLLGKIEP